jgi:hypothetical protein
VNGSNHFSYVSVPPIDGKIPSWADVASMCFVEEPGICLHVGASPVVIDLQPARPWTDDGRAPADENPGS